MNTSDIRKNGYRPALSSKPVPEHLPLLDDDDGCGHQYGRQEAHSDPEAQMLGHAAGPHRLVDEHHQDQQGWHGPEPDCHILQCLHSFLEACGPVRPEISPEVAGFNDVRRC